MAYIPMADDRSDRFRMSVEQYRHFQTYGYLKVQNLISQNDVRVLADWADAIQTGNIPLPGIGHEPMGFSVDAKIQALTRVHMLHRINATAEWGLLHPRVLDVVEVLVGPDVYALQSMLFFNPPGHGGQGWHQDAYYIPTLPESLIGAWMALEPADEENGCLWVAPGSQTEPIYPVSKTPSFVHANGAFLDLTEVQNVSHLDDEVNTLSNMVRQYSKIDSVPMNPGDVLFFDSHLFHRSFPNRTKDRYRRSYVCHYCNARSWVPWNHGASFEGDAANYLHILARGQTHLPYASPTFNTPVTLYNPSNCDPGFTIRMMMEDDSGMMGIKKQG